MSLTSEMCGLVIWSFVIDPYYVMVVKVWLPGPATEALLGEFLEM